MVTWHLPFKGAWRNLKNAYRGWRSDASRCEVCGAALFASIASLLIIDTIVLVPSYQSHLATLHENMLHEGEALLQQIDFGLQLSNNNAISNSQLEKILDTPGVTSLTFHDQAGNTLRQIGNPTVDVSKLLATASGCCDLAANSVLDTDNQKVLAARLLVDNRPVTATLQLDSSQVQQQARSYIIKILSLIGITCLTVLISVVAVLSRHAGKLHFAAYHDAQTGLFNRRRLQQILDDELPQHLNYTIVVFDLDGFSTTQLRWGEEHATRLIQHIGLEVTKVLDASDVLFRFQQDQFAVLVRNRNDRDTAAALYVVDKIRSALLVPVQLENELVRLTACYGVYQNKMPTSETVSSSDIINRLTLALETAKAQGNDQMYEFGTDLQQAHDHRISVITSLRSALAKEQLSLHYQPQFRAADGSIAGIESLMRWNHPDMGAISPVEFIPLTEQTGIIVDFGTWAIQTAVEQYTAWRSQGFNLPCISVNLSPRQLIDKDLVKTVTDIIDFYHLKPGELEFEITESAVIGNPLLAQQKMLALHALGVVFAIDDFGTGHSSLSNLGSFPFSRLKIDQSFVRDLQENKNSRVIVRTCIDLAHKLGMDVVAEGVETREGYELLREWKCDIIQGYYFSKPLSTGDTQDLLEELQRPCSGHSKAA